MEMIEGLTETMTDPEELEKIENLNRGMITDTKNLVKMSKNFW